MLICSTSSTIYFLLQRLKSNRNVLQKELTIEVLLVTTRESKGMNLTSQPHLQSPNENGLPSQYYWDHKFVNHCC